MFLKKVSFHAFLMFLGFSLFWVVYATINYSECFPNGCTLFQSLTNGWVTPISSTSKEIMTPQGCKKVTAWATTKRYFIPTRTLTEWNSFKNNSPWGASITECPINGVCSWSANTCSVGTPSGYNPWSCGGSQTWTCLGQYGGMSDFCSIANPPCAMNGVCWWSANTCNAGTAWGYNAGSCGGSQTWTCYGQNGGIDASCSIANPPCSTPVNGACWWSVNTCSAGVFMDIPDSSSSYQWQCNWQNGGANSPTCSSPFPASYYSCSIQTLQIYECDVCWWWRPYNWPSWIPCLKAWWPNGLYVERNDSSVSWYDLASQWCSCPSWCSMVSYYDVASGNTSGNCDTGAYGSDTITRNMYCACP
jgi:hypothetical protein